MTDLNRGARASGVLAPTASLAGIALAITFTPTFSWEASALSDLGTASAPMPWLFNGGLILSGLLAVPFAWWRWRQASNPLESLAAVGVVGTGFALTGVGLFPSGTALHFPLAAGFYLLLTYTLFLDGSGRVLAGGVVRGLAWIWVGVVHLSGWLLWALTGIGGLAVPETFGALILAAWLVTAAFSGNR